MEWSMYETVSMFSPRSLIRISAVWNCNTPHLAVLIGRVRYEFEVLAGVDGSRPVLGEGEGGGNATVWGVRQLTSSRDPHLYSITTTLVSAMGICTSQLRDTCPGVSNYPPAFGENLAMGLCLENEPRNPQFSNTFVRILWHRKSGRLNLEIRPAPIK